MDASVEAQKNGSTVIVGGGDTGESESYAGPTTAVTETDEPLALLFVATLVAQQGAEDKLAHVSTGGGAR